MLESIDAPLLDRAGIERLLEVSPRQALRILHRLGAVEAGKNLFLARTEAVERLRAIGGGQGVRYERKRLERLNRIIDELRRDWKAHNVPIRVGPGAADAMIPSLPAKIQLHRGRLEIQFETPQELLSSLFELAQAIANDFDQFELRAACDSWPDFSSQ